MKLFPLNPSVSRGYIGLGKLIPIKFFKPSEANTARPVACPGGGVRKITREVPAMMRVEMEARALAVPIDSKCLATNSSGVILSVADKDGLAKEGTPWARMNNQIIKASSLLRRRWFLLIMIPRSS